MTFTLDAATEKRIQREIDLGNYANPAEVVAHAVARLVGETHGGLAIAASPSEDALDQSFGAWAGRGIDGLEYQFRMRAEWDGRDAAFPVPKNL